jgi:hypothetical protein
VRETKQGTSADGPAQDEEDAIRLRSFFKEIAEEDLFAPLGLSRKLYDLVPVDNDGCLFEYFEELPLVLLSDFALNAGSSFKEAMQALD